MPKKKAITDDINVIQISKAVLEKVENQLFFPFSHNVLKSIIGCLV